MLFKLFVLTAIVGSIAEVTLAVADENGVELFDPKTKQPLHMSGYSISSFGTKNYNFNSPSCNDGKYFVNCCVGVRIHGNEHNACADMTLQPDSASVLLKAVVDGRNVWSHAVSPANYAKVCEDITGPLRACINVVKVEKQGSTFTACIGMKFKAGPITVYHVELGCGHFDHDRVWVTRS